MDGTRDEETREPMFSGILDSDQLGDLKKEVNEFLFSRVPENMTIRQFEDLATKITAAIENSHGGRSPTFPEYKRRGPCEPGGGLANGQLTYAELAHRVAKYRELLSRVVHKYEAEWGETIEEIRAEIE